MPEERRIYYDATDCNRFGQLHGSAGDGGSGKTPLDELSRVAAVVKNAKTAVAGGVNMSIIDAAKEIGPEIIIAGGALTKAADLRAAVLAMQKVIKA